MTARVVADAAEALARCAAGDDVVLILPPGGVRPPVSPSAAGKLAVLVGDPADPKDLEAAAEMDAELFGPGRPGR